MVKHPLSSGARLKAVLRSFGILLTGYALAALGGAVLAWALPLHRADRALIGTMSSLVLWPVTVMAGFFCYGPAGHVPFRKAMAWLHNWAGIVTGWVIYIIVLSGTLSVFRPEIGIWMRPELQGRIATPAQALQTAVNWLSAHAATSSAWYLTLFPGPDGLRAPFVWAVWQAPDGTFMQRALDPLTGAPDVIRDTLGGDFFYRFHFELQLPYPWGRLLAAIAALALVLALLSGVIIHRRIFIDFFTFRPAKGRRSWLDAHNVGGVAALPFHLVIALSGAVTLATLLFPWSVQTVYHNDINSFAGELQPGSAPLPLTGMPARLTAIAPLMQKLRQNNPDFTPAQIYIYNPMDSASLIVFSGDDQGSIGNNSHVLRIEGKSGEVLSDTHEHRSVISLFSVLYGLHVAHFADTFTRWLYFLSGLLLAVVIASGLCLWVSHPKRQGGMYTIIARLNPVIITGGPVALSSYFIINRLLPVSWASRAEYEVQSMFILWAVLVFICACLPARLSWRLLCGLMSIILLTIAILSMTVPGAIGTSFILVSLTLAAAFIAAILHKGRTP